MNLYLDSLIGVMMRVINLVSKRRRSGERKLEGPLDPWDYLSPYGRSDDYAVLADAPN